MNLKAFENSRKIKGATNTQTRYDCKIIRCFVKWLSIEKGNTLFADKQILILNISVIELVSYGNSLSANNYTDSEIKSMLHSIQIYLSYLNERVNEKIELQTDLYKLSG